MCGRSGTLLTFVPPKSFELLQGEENLTDYQFNKKVIHHLFCKTCGVRSFGRGEGPQGPMVAITARCLEGVDPQSLPVMGPGLRGGDGHQHLAARDQTLDASELKKDGKYPTRDELYDRPVLRRH